MADEKRWKVPARRWLSMPRSGLLHGAEKVLRVLGVVAVPNKLSNPLLLLADIGLGLSDISVPHYGQFVNWIPGVCALGGSLGPVAQVGGPGEARRIRSGVWVIAIVPAARRQLR
jgi:hypothetical protein